MAAGSLDIAIGYLPEAPNALIKKTLFREPICLHRQTAVLTRRFKTACFDWIVMSRCSMCKPL